MVDLMKNSGNSIRTPTDIMDAFNIVGTPLNTYSTAVSAAMRSFPMCAANKPFKFDKTNFGT